MGDLDKIIKSRDLIDFILDNFIMNSSPLEKFICSVMVRENQFDMDKILEKISEHKLKISDMDTTLAQGSEKPEI